jgi:hypothetical protein
MLVHTRNHKYLGDLGDEGKKIVVQGQPWTKKHDVLSEK